MTYTQALALKEGDIVNYTLSPDPDIFEIEVTIVEVLKTTGHFLVRPMAGYGRREVSYHELGY